MIYHFDGRADSFIRMVIRFRRQTADKRIALRADIQTGEQVAVGVYKWRHAGGGRGEG